MPTIRDSLYFYYDGKSSRRFNLINISLDSGMYDETLVANKTINETPVRGSDTPLFHSVDEEPLEFEMALAFEGTFTDEDIDEIIMWLFQDKYKPLYFEDKPNKVFQCMPTGDSRIVHNGLKLGYVTINMRCKSSKIESPTIYTETYDFSAGGNGNKIIIENTGHVEVFPEISIEKIEDGSITILNKHGAIFDIHNLTNKENIYINTEKEIIETDIIGVYRYEDVVGHYDDMVLELKRNEFTIQGKCKIRLRYKLKYRF